MHSGMSDAGPTPLGTFPDGLQATESQLRPYDWFAHCRETGPVIYDSARACYDVFDYPGVKRVLSEHNQFSSDPRTNPNNTEADLNIISRSILYQDSPRHDELRSVVDDFFKPGTIKELTPDIEGIANDLLDAVVADCGEGEGEFDLVQWYAYPLSVIVIAGLLGIPREDRDRFREWSTAIVASSSQGDDSKRDVQQQAYADMETYFDGLLADRREDPREDLLSRLVQAGNLSDDEMFAFAILLLAAGNLTTTNLIANAIWCLGDEGYLNDVRSGSKDLELAIEEVLRYRSPGQALHRWTTEDLALGGEEIPAGTSVVAWINAANRDPVAFEDAQSFIPDRRPNRHIAFGQGIHTCLGASLARLEGRIAISTLLERFDHLVPLTDDLLPLGSVMIYGPRSLPVRY